MKTLHPLLHSLDKKELTAIRYGLKTFKEKGNKYIVLFEYLVGSKHVPNRAEVSRAIYGAPPDTRLTKLVLRLKQKIHHIMISENYLEKSRRVLETEKRRIRVKRNSAAIMSMALVGGYTRDYVEELLDEVIGESLALGMYMEAVHVMRIKRTNCQSRNDEKGYRELTGQIRFYMQSYALDERVQNYYYELMVNSHRPEHFDQESKLAWLEKVLLDFEENSAFVRSEYSIYMHKLFQTEYWETKGDYAKAKEILLESLALVNGSVLPGTFKMMTINNLGMCYTYLGEYKEALACHEKAKTYFIARNKNNYLHTIASEFMLHFYLGQFGQAETLIDELLENAQALHGDEAMVKYRYYKACLLFRKKEPRKALQLLNEIPGLEHDKTAYDVGMRVLRIYCLLAEKRLDEASDHVEVLRRHVDRYKDQQYFSQRLRWIISMLRLMDKRGFTGDAAGKEKELMEKLSAQSGPARWIPRTPELIPFQDWYNEFCGKPDN